ncbi:MAG: diguanylate cyclase [Clostridia bacterium]
MQFINTQYKVIAVSNEDRYGSTAVVEDARRGHMVKTLRIINHQKETQDFVEYMKCNMFDYRNLNHPNLIDFHFFNKIFDIDTKPVVANKYYYTYEYFSGVGIFDFVKSQSFDILLDLAVQLCSLVKYLHMRGFLLCSVNINELFVSYEKENTLLKVATLPYIQGTERSVMFDRENNYFKSPEAFQFGNYSRESDIYLIGTLMFYIFSKINVEGSNFKDELEKFGAVEDKCRVHITEIIRKCTALKPVDRYESVEKIVEDINRRLNKTYNIIDKKHLQKLPRYMTSLVSREHHFKRIIQSVKGYLYESKLQPKTTIIKGGMGTGKAVFIKAAACRLEQEGNTVLFNTLTEDVSCSFYYIIMLIKDVMRTTDKEIIDRYITDISQIIPEIAGVPSTSVYNSVIRQEDKVRLIYRLGNFLLEASAKSSYVMAVNGFDYIDEDSLSVLNYIMRSEGKGRIYFIIGAGIQSIEENPKLKDFCSSLTDMGYADTIELNNLNINETAEYIRLLLGMDKPYLDFAAKVYKETEGNPKFIYEIIYFLFINNHIYINDKGEWVLNELDFDNLNLSFNIDDMVLNKISKLSPTQNEIIKTVSIFNTAVSSDILEKMLNISESELDNQLSQLNTINILSRKVDDWGISFDFSSINLKKSIYERIPTETRLKYHEMASYILEDKFTRENRENKDELIFHMAKAMRYKEAIEYLINAAEKMIASNLVSQAIQFLEQAYNMFGREEVSTEKMAVCSKLGELYEQIGEYNRSMHFYGEVESAASQVNDLKVLIDIYIKRFSLSYKIDEKKIAIGYAVKAKRLLKNVEYREGLYELVISLNDIMSNKRKYNSYMKILERVMNTIDTNKFECFYARALVTYGRFICNKNRYEEGLTILIKGMAILERLSAYKYIPYTLNSIGYVYSEYYNDIQKSREYYEKCSNVSQKLNNLSSMEKSYNNLAELYRIEDRYSETIEYYNKALEVVRISQNMIIKTLLNINLIIASTEMEDYNKAYMYINTSEELLNNLKDSGNILQFYYHHWAEFCYAMGEHEKAAEYAQNAVDLCISWGIAENYEAHFVKLLSEIQLSGRLDYERDRVFLDRVFGENLYKLGRTACVKLAEIYISKGIRDRARELLQRGLSYASNIDTDMLRLRYEYVGALVKEGAEKLEGLTKLAGLIEAVENNEIKWKIYKAIALELVEQKNYREALKYLITSLNYLRKLVYNVPDEYKVRFINSHDRNSVKEGLSRVAELLTSNKPGAANIKTHIIGKRFLSKQRVSLSLHEIDKYFDYTEYRDIYRHKETDETDSKEGLDTSAHVKFLGKMHELMGRFSEDETINLKHMIDLFAEITQAKNAFIATLQEDDSLNVIASYNRYSEVPFYKYVIEQVKQKKDSIIVNDTFEYNARKGDILIPKDITAVFCIPVLIPKENDSIDMMEERRRYREQGSNTIIGYIYLDTDSIINNFTQESSRFCMMAAKMAYVLVDNYNMKVVSTVDKLTKLYTRKYFESALANELMYVEKEGGQFSIIMADIDKFKSVNDRFGHQKGDEVLQSVSGIIMNSVRKGDICGRYGGEEIIILLPGTDGTGAYNVAEKIRKKVENSKLLGLNTSLTISMGVSSYPEHGTWAKDLIDKADQAMYHVKESGRNGSRIYEPNMSKNIKRIDRLAGIISGDLVEDQRKVETMLEILELQRESDKTLEEKMFSFLGRIIEVSEAQTGGIFYIDETEEGERSISSRLLRKKLVDREVEEAYYNEGIVQKCIESRVGEYQIDWSGYPGIDPLTGMPDWQSVIAVPMIDRGRIKGMAYLSVSIKNKEFDAGTYNYVKTLSYIMAAAL